ncbi:hypothetical protein N8D56_19690 [Devosia sp. A8/3-2]|nr:hypothetical protein N8D56_19690 [Devosia sp. A8/3-2]
MVWLATRAEAITAHLTGFTGGILDGEADFYGIHAGATGTFEQFKVRAALGYLYSEVIDDDKIHALISAEAGFDMFTVALSGEYTDAYGNEGYGLGGSVGATITDGIKINLGSRWFHNDTSDQDTIQVAAQLIAAVTETIEVTGEVGGYFGDDFVDWQGAAFADSVGYAALGLKWAPAVVSPPASRAKSPPKAPTRCRSLPRRPSTNRRSFFWIGKGPALPGLSFVVPTPPRFNARSSHGVMLLPTVSFPRKREPPFTSARAGRPMICRFAQPRPHIRVQHLNPT